MLFSRSCFFFFMNCYYLGKSTESVSMKIVNNAGSPIEIFWVNFRNNDLIKQNSRPVRNSTDIMINSYNNHRFLVRFLHHIEGIEAAFAKGPREETITVAYSEETGFMITQLTKVDQLSNKVKLFLDVCSSAGDDHGRVLSSNFSACVAAGVIDDVSRISDSREEKNRYLEKLSSRLRNYTCADPHMETAPSISSKTYVLNGASLKADNLLDTEHAKVWTVDKFISEKECEVLMEHGRNRLVRATVADTDGKSIVSESRKAQQAVYSIDDESDPLWSLYQRVYGIVNTHAGLDLHTDGQEHFTIIQYNPGDQYTPHCDGACDGSRHNNYGRVATAVLYCKVADVGGATVFTNSDIFVKPKNGSATFFSYKGPDGHMDDGMTKHSGCPVIEGEKWITTVWMREGVSKEESWGKYDPQGRAIFYETDASAQAEP